MTDLLEIAIVCLMSLEKVATGKSSVIFIFMAISSTNLRFTLGAKKIIGKLPAVKVANIVIVILLVPNRKVVMSLMVSANVVQDLVEEDVISVKKITMVILPLNVFLAIVIPQDLHHTNAILKLENAIVLKVSKVFL